MIKSQFPSPVYAGFTRPAASNRTRGPRSSPQLGSAGMRTRGLRRGKTAASTSYAADQSSFAPTMYHLPMNPKKSSGSERQYGGYGPRPGHRQTPGAPSTRDRVASSTSAAHSSGSSEEARLMAHGSSVSSLEALLNGANDPTASTSRSQVEPPFFHSSHSTYLSPSSITLPPFRSCPSFLVLSILSFASAPSLTLTLALTHVHTHAHTPSHTPHTFLPASSRRIKQNHAVQGLVGIAPPMVPMGGMALGRPAPIPRISGTRLEPHHGPEPAEAAEREMGGGGISLRARRLHSGAGR